jgi:hypothetical protein
MIIDKIRSQHGLSYLMMNYGYVVVISVTGVGIASLVMDQTRAIAIQMLNTLMWYTQII